MVSIIFSTMVYAAKLAALPGLLRPNHLAVDEQQFYVAEKGIVYIYSLEEYGLKGKFGKAGEGPREFRLNSAGGGLSILPQKEALVLNSIGKISFFTKKGKFIKEIKSPQTSAGFKPIGSRFVGMNTISAGNKMMVAVNIFDGKLTKIKEMAKMEIVTKGRFELPIPNSGFYVLKNKILIGGGEEFVINIFDADGNKVSSISRDYNKLKVTGAYKQAVHHSIKTGRGTKQVYEAIKNLITFREYFPAIQSFWTADEYVYIRTYLEKDGKYEFFVYDLNGKFLKRSFLPIYNRDGINPFPIAVKNNTLYQLVENVDKEVWELHGEAIH